MIGYEPALIFAPIFGGGGEVAPFGGSGPFGGGPPFLLWRPTRFLDLFPYGAGTWPTGTGGIWSATESAAGVTAVGGGRLAIPDGAATGLPADTRSGTGYPAVSPQIDCRYARSVEVDFTMALPGQVAGVGNGFVNLYLNQTAGGGVAPVTGYLQLSSVGNFFAGITGGPAGSGADVNVFVGAGFTGFSGTLTFSIATDGTARLRFGTSVDLQRQIGIAVPAAGNDSTGLNLSTKTKGGAGDLVSITRFLARGRHR